jgi:protein TonB
MNPLALHLPERHGIAQWMLSAAAIVAAHGALVAALVSWHGHTQPDEKIIAAIEVSLVAAPSSSPQTEDQDVAVGPPMEQAAQTLPEPAKVQEQKPIEQFKPSLPQQAR